MELNLHPGARVLLEQILKQWSFNSIVFLLLLFAVGSTTNRAASFVITGTGVAPTPANFPASSAQDLQAVFGLSNQVGRYVVFIYPWSQSNLVDAARLAVQESRASGLIPIIAVSPTVLGGFRSTYDVPDSVRTAVGAGSLSMSNPVVRDAFKATVLQLANLQPDYLCVATEINMMAFVDMQEYSQFAQTYSWMYPDIKSAAPNTKIFVSFQWDIYRILDQSEPDKVAAHTQLIDMFRPSLDVVAFTSYPSNHFATVADMPSSYYSDLKQHTQTTDEVMFMEIGWPTVLAGDEATQANFVNALPALMAAVRPSVLAWSLLHDVPNGVLGSSLATTGLITGDGRLKPAFQAFQQLYTTTATYAPLPLSLNVADRGGVSLTTLSSGPLNVGYAKLQMTGGVANPSGVALFQYRSGGVTVTETAVPATSLIQGGRIYTDINGPANTGIAIANPNGLPATLSFQFTDASGSNFGAGTITVPPNGQFAHFLSEMPFLPGRSLQDARSFTFTSSVPIAAVALRGYTNERADFLITTLPVAAVGDTNTQPLYFPHFADGGGWTTKVVLVNPTDVSLTGVVGFAGSQMANAFPYSIAPRSSTMIQTAGTGDSINVGTIKVSPDATSTTPTGVVIFSFKNNGVTVTETGVPSVAPAQAFRTYVEYSGPSGTASSVQTGLSISNPSQSDIVVSLDLFDLNGQPFGSRGSLTVPASSQASFFLTEVSAFNNLAPGFEGVIRISTDSPQGISVIALRSRYNEREDFLIATMPVIPENTPASQGAVFFPQIVEGGGYTTKFVLFSGSDAQQSSTSMQFLSQSGTNLPLVLVE